MNRRALLAMLALTQAPALPAHADAAADVVQPTLRFPTVCPIMQSFEYGVTELTLTVEGDGSVGNVVVDTSSGHPLLDEAFRQALAKSRVVAGTVDGKPQPMTISVRMDSVPGGRVRGIAMAITVLRGAEPRVAQYVCYGHDPNPFDPRSYKM